MQEYGACHTFNPCHGFPVGDTCSSDSDCRFTSTLSASKARLDRGARACEGRAVVRGLLAPSLQRSTCLNDWWSRLFKVNLRRMCCPLLSPAGSPTRSLHPSVAAAGALRLGGLCCSQTVSHCPPLEPFPPQSLDPGGGLVSRPHCCHRHHADPPHPPLPPPAARRGQQRRRSCHGRRGVRRRRHLRLHAVRGRVGLPRGPAAHARQRARRPHRGQRGGGPGVPCQHRQTATQLTARWRAGWALKGLFSVISRR